MNTYFSFPLPKQDSGALYATLDSIFIASMQAINFGHAKIARITKQKSILPAVFQKNFQNPKTFAGQSESRLMCKCFLFPFKISNSNY